MVRRGLGLGVLFLAGALMIGCGQKEIGLADLAGTFCMRAEESGILMCLEFEKPEGDTVNAELTFPEEYESAWGVAIQVAPNTVIFHVSDLGEGSAVFVFVASDKDTLSLTGRSVLSTYEDLLEVWEPGEKVLIRQ